MQRTRTTYVLLTLFAVELVFWFSRERSSQAVIAASIRDSPDSVPSDLLPSEPSRLSVTLGIPGPGASLLRGDMIRRAEQDSDRYYNIKRRSHDRDYLLKTERASAIKVYLNAPMGNSPSYQQVLEVLVSNGYDITDWVHVIDNLSIWWRTQNEFEEWLHKHAWSPEKKNIHREKFLDHSESERKVLENGIRRMTGIQNEAILESLFSIELEAPPNGSPLGFGLEELSVGEEMMTDDDWLTPVLLALQESYGGEAREMLTIRERLERWHEQKVAERKLNGTVAPDVSTEP